MAAAPAARLLGPLKSLFFFAIYEEYNGVARVIGIYRDIWRSIGFGA